MHSHNNTAGKITLYLLSIISLLNPHLTVGDSDIRTIQEEMIDMTANSDLEQYRTAAEKGNAEAQNRLGLLFYKGEGVKQDYAKALAWFQASANQGNKDAQYHLGLMYYFQMTMSGNQDEKALVYFKKAAQQGHKKAKFAIGMMHYYGNASDGASNYAKAMHWIKLAASQGSPLAQNQIGVMYETGKGVAKQPAEAKYWYQKSAEQGCRDGINNLARLEKQAPMAIKLSNIEPISNNPNNEGIQQTLSSSFNGKNLCYKQCKLEYNRCTGSCGAFQFLGLLAALAGDGRLASSGNCSACGKYLSTCTNQC